MLAAGDLPSSLRNGYSAHAEGDHRPAIPAFRESLWGCCLIGIVLV